MSLMLSGDLRNPVRLQHDLVVRPKRLKSFHLRAAKDKACNPWGKHCFTGPFQRSGFVPINVLK
jgi:hypothetical protein